jgi:hypothetical protein
MPSYIPIDRVAERLNVTADRLGEFQRRGWIWIVEKEGSRCIPEHQECKVQFILHLQQVLKLSPQQISALLIIEGPPYSLNDYDVDRILAEARSSERDVTTGACVHEGADWFAKVQIWIAFKQRFYANGKAIQTEKANPRG